MFLLLDHLFPFLQVTLLLSLLVTLPLSLLSFSLHLVVEGVTVYSADIVGVPTSVLFVAIVGSI